MGWADDGRAARVMSERDEGSGRRRRRRREDEEQRVAQTSTHRVQHSRHAAMLHGQQRRCLGCLGCLMCCVGYDGLSFSCCRPTDPRRPSFPPRSAARKENKREQNREQNNTPRVSQTPETRQRWKVGHASGELSGPSSAAVLLPSHVSPSPPWW
ncbi:hypothetical protein VTN02DRAFT_4497 [Thermoascus thermophilus]